jgi:hypothetical protein
MLKAVCGVIGGESARAVPTPVRSFMTIDEVSGSRKTAVPKTNVLCTAVPDFTGPISLSTAGRTFR